MAAGRTCDHRHPAALLHDYARERSCNAATADTQPTMVYPSVYPSANEKKRVSSFEANPLILLAEWTGLEPATPGVTGRYSNQLNYHSLVRTLAQLTSSFLTGRIIGLLRKPCQTWRPLGDSNPCNHRERVVS